MVGLSIGCLPPGTSCLYPQPGTTCPPTLPGGRPLSDTRPGAPSSAPGGRYGL